MNEVDEMKTCDDDRADDEDEAMMMSR